MNNINNILDKRSLTLIALIKYEIVQLNKALNDKNCSNSDVEKIEEKIAQFLALLQFTSNSGSSTETLKLLCKWINQSKLLADTATEFLNSEEFAQATIGLDERDFKELDHVRESLAETIKIEINEKELKKQLLNSKKGN